MHMRVSARLRACVHACVFVCVCACVCVSVLEGGWYIKAPSFHLVPENLTEDPWENDTLGMISQSPTQLRVSVLL